MTQDTSLGHCGLMRMSSDGEQSPTPEQLDRWRRRSGPPENEVPGAVAWAALLGRGEDIAVAITGAGVYSTGLRLDLAVRARRRPTRRGAGSLLDALGGHRHNGGPDRLLLGVEYADGRTTTNAESSAWPPAEPADEQPVLHRGGGGGSDRTVDTSLFLSPLPRPDR